MGLYGVRFNKHVNEVRQHPGLWKAVSAFKVIKDIKVIKVAKVFDGDLEIWE